jgi:hypothetical protein
LSSFTCEEVVLDILEVYKTKKMSPSTIGLFNGYPGFTHCT